MRTKEDIRALLDSLRTGENEAVNFNEEAIYTAYQKDNYDQSLTIKILSVFGGLFASIMCLVFLYLSGLQNSEIGLLMIGAICVAGAIWVNKIYDKIVIDTVTISSYMIGFVLLGLGLDKIGINESMVYFMFISIAFCSLYIVQRYVISFISVLIVNGSILSLIISNTSYYLIYAYVSVLGLMVTYLFLNEAKIITAANRLSRLYNSIRVGLIISFLVGLLFLGKIGILPVSFKYVWLASLTIISAIIYLVSRLFDLLQVTKKDYKFIIYLACVLILLPTLFSPAISGAFLIILLSFLVNYKTGLAIGLIAFMYFICQYYYDLQFTLLTKSILLFLSGFIFFILYLVTHKKLKPDEKF